MSNALIANGWMAYTIWMFIHGHWIGGCCGVAMVIVMLLPDKLR